MVTLAVVAKVQHAAHLPGGTNPLGLPTDSWAPAVPVDSHGWWQPNPDEIATEPGRRSQEIVRSLLIPNDTACADKDRWTLPGDGTYEQVGRPQDYNHGPFGMSVPLIVHLKTVEG